MKHSVIKLGGSVLRGPCDAEAILSTLDGYKGPLVVVVSALKGVTERLGAALSAPTEASELISELREEYREFAAAFGAPAAAREAGLVQIERLLGGLSLLFDRRAADGAARIHATRILATRILATGERLSAVCVALALAALGRPAPVIEPGRLGLVALPPVEGSDGSEADIPASAPRIRAALSGVDAAVVPGFYGVGSDGEPRLFGRGGSDYSAAVIAACIGAASCDFIKGVAGFFTADPALVPGARPVRDLSYAEAEALALGGANILHQRCVEPLRASLVPLRILGGPSLAGQTRVGEGRSAGPRGPQALALRRGPTGGATITVAGGGASKAAAAVLLAFEASGLQARAFSPGRDGSSFRFLVDGRRGDEALRVAHDALFA